MSSRVFQGVILQLKEATSRTIGVINAEGLVVASSETSMIGEKWSDAAFSLNQSPDAVILCAGRTFKTFENWRTSFDYAAFVEGVDDDAHSLCIMACVALSAALSNYEERHDKGTFVKNVITDNILPGDIYIRAKELHFVTDIRRAVMLIRQVERADVAALDILKHNYSNKQTDYLLNINETDIAFIREISEGTTTAELDQLAATIENTLRTELFIKAIVGIGTVANHLRELADSYKEAQIAIEVGKVFDTERRVINYENLGIGRLIYQLPTTLCEIFLSEVFKKNSIDSLDQETLFTINKFFENNLNVSETSRKLFVHRNTLVYRLEKIKKLTGLDLRQFDHAIVFKVALMVRKYLTSRENRSI